MSMAGFICGGCEFHSALLMVLFSRETFASMRFHIGTACFARAEATELRGQARSQTPAEGSRFGNEGRREPQNEADCLAPSGLGSPLVRYPGRCPGLSCFASLGLGAGGVVFRDEVRNLKSQFVTSSFARAEATELRGQVRSQTPAEGSRFGNEGTRKELPVRCAPPDNKLSGPPDSHRRLIRSLGNDEIRIEQSRSLQEDNP